VKEKLTILENIFRHTVVDIVIDYQISYDITGKVYKVVPLIYQLPESAQRLILGGDKEEKKQEIENFKNLISLILPLGIMNQSNFYVEELAGFYKAINDEIKSQKIIPQKLYEYAEEESFEWYILSAYLNPDIRPDPFSEFGERIKYLVQYRSNPSNLYNLTYFSKYYPSLGYKIITLILPFINNAYCKKHAYECIGEYKNIESKTYLIEALVREKKVGVIGGIFGGLSKHNLKEDLSIQQKIITVFNSGLELDENAKLRLIELLKHFTDSSTK